ncbi:MAG: hypothetical protein JAZ11_03025 [Candidatus Thiodiazotropha lotti]|nr:hypothetical protein [Candidatus Thiodiazotropha lotti]
MKPEILAVLEGAQARIEDLRTEAKGMVDEHWGYYLEESKKRTDFSEKSRLFPRVGKTKNAFTIEWYHIKKWYKNLKGEWKKTTRYVARGKGYRVNLTRYSRPWELDKLNEFEVEAELIRREVAILTDLISRYRRLDALVQKRDKA